MQSKVDRATGEGNAAYLQKFDNAPHAEEPQDENDVQWPPSSLVRDCQHHDLHTQAHLSVNGKTSFLLWPLIDEKAQVCISTWYTACTAQ